MDQVTVRSTQGPGRVALWERHPDHPNGEIFINDTAQHTIAHTHVVKQRIRQGFLEQIGDIIRSEPEPESAQAPWDGYDDLNVEEVLAELESAEPALAAAVLEYESAHKARKGILEALADA